MTTGALTHAPAGAGDASAARYPLSIAIVLMLAAGAAVVVPLAAVSALLGTSFGLPTVDQATGGSSPSAVAVSDIPARYLALYREAAARYGLDWTILAGIGRVECDHGRDPDPSCTSEEAVNSAGAGGPMQFLASTWARYGVDGDRDGRVDRWNPADAIFSAARYLRASGAPGDYRRAIFAYNHAGWYVEEVERWAASYRGAAHAGGVTTGESGAGAVAGEALSSNGAAADSTTAIWPGVGPVQMIPGPSALLSPSDGHTALVPEQAPPVVQAMVIAGNELQDLPYGADGHPDPRGATSEDCSSTVNYVLYRSGVRQIEEIVRQNPLAQDYLDWGEPGPGRWVTIYSTTEPTNHVFIVIAGLRLDTSHNGTDVGPNRNQDGPRWRILDHIPTWAHWSVKHPPGL